MAWMEERAARDSGQVVVDKEQIRTFAAEFDPQPFHTDPAAAARTEYGGLIASGWHTAALMMRMYSDHYLSHVATLVSPGIDEIRWVLAVRPGDVLQLSFVSGGRSHGAVLSIDGRGSVTLHAPESPTGAMQLPPELADSLALTAPVLQ